MAAREGFAVEATRVAGSNLRPTGVRFGSPYPLGHQSLGLVRCSACLTVWLPEGSRFAGSSKAISPKWPCRVPVTGSDSWFRRVASILTSAPWPTLLLTNGSSIDRPRGGQIHIVPDTRVPSADRGNPVPTNRRMIGRVIRAQRAAVLVGIIEGLLLDAAGRGILLHQHGQRVPLSGMHAASDIEPAAHESAFNAPQFLAIKEDIRFPVDAIEVEPCVLAARPRRHHELVAIPEIGIEK